VVATKLRAHDITEEIRRGWVCIAIGALGLSTYVGISSSRPLFLEGSQRLTVHYIAVLLGAHKYPILIP